jgi:hypothetical protein|eukprot:COSAG02_NODE_7970_length_2766_cov_1.593551_5_plen_118_part_00
MAAGADNTVQILDDRHLFTADLLPPTGQEAEEQQHLQLGPPLRDPESTMALLEFDCGPAPAAPVQQPALLLDQLAPLPELPPVEGVHSQAAIVLAKSVRQFCFEAMQFSDTVKLVCR